MQTIPKALLALDVGEKRIGVALASLEARIASPLTALPNDENLTARLQQIVENNAVDEIVIGLPRGLDGQRTQQTAYAEDFANNLQNALGLTAHLQDEAVTSAQAEAELRSRGKPYAKGDIDSLSAVYILEDYLQGGKN